MVKQTLDEALKNSLVEIKKIKDVKHLTEGIESYDFVKRAYLKSVDTSHSSDDDSSLKKEMVYMMNY